MNNIIDRVKAMIFEGNASEIRKHTQTECGFTIGDGSDIFDFIFDKVSDTDEYDYRMHICRYTADIDSEIEQVYTAYIKEDISEIKLTFVYADRTDKSFLHDVFGFSDFDNGDDDNTECDVNETSNETSMDESTLSLNLCDKETFEIRFIDNVKRINIELEYTDDIDIAALGEKIHNALVGNKDYIDSNILLNCDNPKELYLFRDNIHGDADGAKRFNEVLDIIKNA